MIQNPTELELALGQLDTYQAMLEALRVKLVGSAPAVFPVMAGSYLARIREMESDVVAYLRARPADSPVSVRVSGPSISHGIINATLASKLLAALQGALYQIAGLYGGEESQKGESRSSGGEGTSLRALLGLNLVATSSGSFVLALDLAPRQLKLFNEYDTAAKAVRGLIQHVNELEVDASRYSGTRPMLRGIRKLSSLARKGVDSIAIRYEEQGVREAAAVTPAVHERVEYLLGSTIKGERVIVGRLIEINIKTNSCEVDPEKGPPVTCLYDEAIEDELVGVLKKRIEMAGEFAALDWPPGHFRITKIERFRVLESEADDLE